MTPGGHGTDAPGADLPAETEFTAEERGDTVAAPVRRLLLGLALVVLLGAAVGVVWGNDELREAVAGDGAASAEPDARAHAATDDSAVRALQGEDARLRAAAAGTPLPGTVVLAARAAPYGLDSLVARRAVTREGPRTLLLRRSVVVAPGARLDLQAPHTTLRLRSDADGFTSIVGWGGDVRLAGGDDAPLRLVGWDAAAQRPDDRVSDGRSYVRVKDAMLELEHVRADHLGFWSGRTGGIAATGTSEALTRARIADVRAEHVHQGLYLSGVEGASVRASAFGSTAQAGIEITNQSSRVVLDDVEVRDTGAAGVAVSRASSQLTLTGVDVERTRGYGLFVDGGALADGPNSAGWSTRDSAGLTVTGLRVRDAERGGVRVDAMQRTRLWELDVADSGVALDVRGRADDARVGDADLRGRSPDLEASDADASGAGGPQPAVRISQAAGVVLAGVRAEGAQTAVLVEHGARVSIVDARLRVVEGHAAAARGDGSEVEMRGGSVGGRGAGSVVGLNGGAGEASEVDADAWSYRPALVTWILGDVHLLLLLLLAPVPVVGLAFVRRRRRDQGTLRHRFQEEAMRLGRERLAEYAVARAEVASVAAIAAAVATVTEATEATEAAEAAEAAPVTVVEPVREPAVAPVAAPPPVEQAPSLRDLAIAAVVEQGYRASDVARSLGVPTSRVRGWVADAAALTGGGE